MKPGKRGWAAIRKQLEAAPGTRFRGEEGSLFQDVARTAHA